MTLTQGLLVHLLKSAVYNCVSFYRDFFSQQWEKYLQTRGLSDGKGPANFPENYGPKERDVFYESLSWGRYTGGRGWGGSSGHDAPMIA